MKFVPSFKEHLTRYVFAMPYVYKGKSVIDVGSGDGYGGMLLSYGASKVSLVDNDPQRLKRAKLNYKYFCEDVEFLQVDLEKEYPKGKWDVATAFEVIEHVEDPHFLVANIAEHLTEGGCLVFSVPHMVANHEHKTLFDEEGIKKLVGKYLTIDEFYVQDKQIFSDKPLYKDLKCYVGVAYKR